MTQTKNEHVWDYLTYYLALPHSPNFAVLISGPWGVGKTFLVKRFLASHFESQKDKYVYVSLYGLSSLEEIDDALLQAIFPRLTGTTATVIGRLAKSALKVMKIDASEFKIQDFLNKFDGEVYVFDDLERFEGSWPAPGSEDTELGVFMGPEVRHGEAEVYARVQA